VKKLAAVILALGASLALTGCSKDARNTDAVRQAVVDHLGKRGDLNLSTMNIEVTNVEYGKNNDAIATVSFAPKGESGGMSMRYHLVQEGGRWVVQGKQDSGGMGHGGGMTSPHGGAMPPPEGPPSGGAADLPPGHPPVNPPKK
jgi:hypothetical protein